MKEMSNVERWSRAVEEMKFYDNQLKEIPKTLLFQDMLRSTAPRVQDARAQLFNPEKRVVKRRVSNRTAKV